MVESGGRLLNPEAWFGKQMCARYTQVRDLRAFLAQVLCVQQGASFTPRYNIAPKQTAPVIVPAGNQYELKLMRWGLIPSWAKDEKIGQKLINARAESLAEKPSFRQAYQQRRCLVPADGFYEWQTTLQGKIPHRFTLADEAPFCFAGLWEIWRPPPAPQGDLFAGEKDASMAEPLATFTIITTKANAVVEPLHDRMPVILAPFNFTRWLSQQTPLAELDWLLQPYPADQMRCQRVSPRVNNPRFEGPECLAME